MAHPERSRSYLRLLEARACPVSGFEIGTRVRIVAHTSVSSRIHAGKTGTVVLRSERLAAAEDALYCRAYPNSVRLDNQNSTHVWRDEEIEVIK